MATEGNLVGGLSRLVNRLGLLGVEDKTLLALEGDANSLVVHETGMLREQSQHGSGVPSTWLPVLLDPGFLRACVPYLAGVLVHQVQGVAGELDATSLLALDKEGVVVT